MNWLILFIVSLLSLSIALLFVSCTARLFSWIPRAGVRKWIAIGTGALSAILLVQVLGVLVYGAIFSGFSSDDEPWRSIVQFYRRSPTAFLLWFVPAVVGAIVYFGITVYGFLPAKNVPYVPQAAAWRISQSLKWIGLLLLLLCPAIVVQDIELRLRLRNMEAGADAAADALKPAAVAVDQNAATHYQRIVDTMPDIDAWKQSEGIRDISIEVTDCNGVDKKTHEYFKHLKPMLNELRRAAECEKCRYDDRYAVLDSLSGFKTNFSVQCAITILGQYAKYEICQQRPSSAIDCIRIIRRWEDHLLADPRNIGINFFNLAERTVREIAEHLATYGVSCRRTI